MKKLLTGLALACSLSVSLPSLAEVDEGTARSLLQENGTWQALGDIPTQLTSSMKNGMGGAAGMLPPDLIQALVAAAEGAFTAERTRAAALPVMSKGLDAATVAEVRKWTGTPLGQKIVAQEKTAVSADSAKRKADGQAELQKADEARRKVYADILQATRAVDQMAEVSIITSLAMVQGMSAANPAMAQGMPPAEQMRGLLEGQIAAAKPQMQAELLSNTAALYAPISTAELQQYLTYLRSPAGAKMNELTFAAISAALKEGGTEFAKRLTGAMKLPGTG